MNFCIFRRLTFTQIKNSEPLEIAKNCITNVLQSVQLISRKIWVTEFFHIFNNILYFFTIFLSLRSVFLLNHEPRTYTVFLFSVDYCLSIFVWCSREERERNWVNIEVQYLRGPISLHTVKNLGRGSNRENRPTTVLVHFYTSEVWMRYSDPNINSSFFFGIFKNWKFWVCWKSDIQFCPNGFEN